MKCPNCGGEIGRFELNPNCKHCGVNIFYFQQEELLTEDAKKCELEYASFRVLISKMKSAFIKGSLPIARMVLTILTICSVLVPFVTLKTDISVISKKLTLSGLGLYSAFTDGTMSAVINLIRDGFLQDSYIKSVLVSIGIVAIILCAIILLVVELLSFVNISKTAKIMKNTAIVGLVFSVFSAVCSLLLSVGTMETFLKCNMGIGAFVAIAMFSGDIIVNKMFLSHNIQAQVNDIDLQRIEIRKKVKIGEIKLSDLPLPVLESDEEHEKRLKEQANDEIPSNYGEDGDYIG